MTTRGARLRLVALSEDRSLRERLAGSVSEQVELFADRMREGLLAASVAIGLEVMGELVEAEVSELAGPKGKHDPARMVYRHGSESGKVTLGGRRVPVRRPRVRTLADEDGAGREVRLESYDAFAAVDLLSDRMVASMLAGLSGRRYERTLEPVGEQVERSASGVSQSSVSRRFITATAERLAAFRSRPLDSERWLIVFVDGFDFAGHTMVGALGVTAEGTKVPLGVVEGSTENASVARGLISDLRDRGLDAAEGVLFVLDGGKALAKATREVFGEQAVIARCRLHKERNVLDHLPEGERLWVRRKLRAAWANPDVKEAEAALAALAGQLEKVNPDAAASLREGLADTLTVTRLGITGSLLKTVMSTNPVESMIEIVRAHARNVKHWQRGDMRLRWAAAGMLAASAQFRRVKGYKQLPALAAALHHAVSADVPSTIAVSA
ncbi:MAG TPA: IS256 family transposase [Gaiellaceae bacterium]|nr:IS256 family transposase [Gaiellaceae bacterium]